MKKERYWKGTESLCLCFLCCLAAMLRVTQIHGLTGLGWQCTRKVIRAATVLNPSEYKTLPISVRLNGKRWNTLLCGMIWRSQHRGVDSSPHTQALIICVCACVGVCVHACMSVCEWSKLTCFHVFCVHGSGACLLQWSKLRVCSQCTARVQCALVCMLACVCAVFLQGYPGEVEKFIVREEFRHAGWAARCTRKQTGAEIQYSKKLKQHYATFLQENISFKTSERVKPHRMPIST